MYSRYGMNGDFVTFPMHLLDGRVIGIFMRNEESCLDVAPVGILTFTIEYIFVQFDVVVVDGVVESDGDHLGYVFGRQVVRRARTVFRAETVWQRALRQVARRRAVRIVLRVCTFGRDITIL